MPITKNDLPKYWTLMYPILLAAEALGGSGHKKELLDRVIEDQDVSEEMLALVYGGDSGSRRKNKSMFFDRLEWALSYCKLTGVLLNPERALYALSGLGREVLKLGEDDARKRLRQMDTEVRKSRGSSKAANSEKEELPPDEGDPPSEEDDVWKSELLDRLHQLSPEAFEEITLLLLRSYGMSLKRVGGSGDEGIDGIGSAPLSPVLSSTVAVQCKRYDPSSTVSRDAVALFQRDATAKGAERAVMVTLGRFTGPAQKAAQVTKPTVDLIDGDRLCELVLEKELGARLTVEVDEKWFQRFTGESPKLASD